MGYIREVVFDCSKAAPLARFWASMMDGYAVRPYSREELKRLKALGFTRETDPTVMIDGPGPSFCFRQVSTRRGDSSRIRFEIAVEDREAAVMAAHSLGATYVRERAGYTLMLDPEGNQFGLIEDD